MIRNIIFGVYLDFQIFWRKVSKPTKTSKKDNLSHYTVSLRKPCPFYKPQLTQHCKDYTPATRPITLLTFQIFQTKCFSLFSEKKNLHWTISRSPRTTFSKHLESKCLCILVYFLKKFLFQWRRKLLSEGGLNNFIQATRCLALAECLKMFYFSIEVFRNLTIFQHFDTSINSNDKLKFSRQFWLQG